MEAAPWDMRIITETISRDELARRICVVTGCTTQAGRSVADTAVEPIIELVADKVVCAAVDEMLPAGL
jgi:hypothetical protein